MFMKYEKHSGTTPKGGAYSEIYYLDNDNNNVDSKKATKLVIRECREDGSLIAETYALYSEG